MFAKPILFTVLSLSISLVGCKKEDAKSDKAATPAATAPAPAPAPAPAAADPAAAAAGESAKATKEDCEKAFKNQTAIEPDATMKKSMETSLPKQVEMCAGSMSKAATDCMATTTDPTKIGECALR